ncbi:MAG: hypothetical protein ABJG33_17090 [Balneola sp.]
MPSILESIQLWDASRTGAVTLPQTFKSIISRQPDVTKELGRPYSMRMSIKSSSDIATASSSDDYYLSKKKIIRLVYDDSSFEEWRIKRVTRETNGTQDLSIECEPIWQDLAYNNVRQTLSTGVVRSQVNFYSTDLEDVITALFGTDYNAPSLFQKGSIAAGVASKELRLSFNGASFMEVLFQISQSAEAEWDVSWNSGDSKYDVNFYALGDLGGGTGQASDRVIAMGGGDGNRKNLLVRDSEEDYISRLEPICGSGEDTKGIGGVVFNVSGSGVGPTILTMDDNYIPSNGFLLLDDEDLFFGNDVDGWFEVVNTLSPNQVLVDGGDASGLTEGSFSIGSSKSQMVFMEDADAVSDIGVVERTYRRTDIAAYVNEIKKQGISDDFSTFSSGVPVGTAKVGTPTVSEESSDEFVKFGSKSCKVVADTGEGLSWDVEIDNEYPYFSLLTYLNLTAGSIKMEFEDSDGNLVPEGRFAETSEFITQALSMEGAKPASGTATIRVVALEDSTTFYLDACVLTNSPTAQAYQPLMGVYDLWKESARQLNLYGGIQPNEYNGSCWDNSYFDGASREIEVGSWVTVKDGWNGTSYSINFTGRVLSVRYIDEFKHGRVEKVVEVSNRPTDLEQFLKNTYMTRAEFQQNNDIPFSPSLDALGIAIKEGNVNVTREGFLTLLAAYIGDFEISTDGAGTSLDGGTKRLLIQTSSGNINLYSDSGNIIMEALTGKVIIAGLGTTDPSSGGALYTQTAAEISAGGSAKVICVS